MKKWLLPIRILLLFLFALAFFATLSWNGLSPEGWLTSIRNFAFLYLSSLFTFLVLRRFSLATPTLWEHRLITCLILYLLFDSLAPWWLFLALGAASEFLERLLRLPSGPVFNPAGFGAFAVSLFGYLPTWWGTNFSPRLPIFEEGVSIAALFTVLIAGYVAHRYKKLPIAIIGLFIFSLAYFFVFQTNPLPVALEGTLLFFFLVMAIEPKTSPGERKEQLIYGSLIGILIPLGLFFGFPESYLGGLLLGNLYKNRKALFGLLDGSLFSSKAGV